MLEEYVYRGKERLRCGYTTGSCAAGAAKAAALMLLSQGSVRLVELMTPKGILLQLPVRDCEFMGEYARCAVEKDSGDDPDITKGILVYATVSFLEDYVNQERNESNETDSDIEREDVGLKEVKSGADAESFREKSGVKKLGCFVEIDGGEGVGRVTRPGLDQPVGAAAINSTPRRMIEAAVLEVAEEYEYTGGIRVVISVPGGEEIAKKTFNPRLGIEGGISILGTSGIVEPMSSAALLETIRVEENIYRKEGKTRLFLTLGNYGRNFLAEYEPDLFDRSVKCSNFIGDAIDMGLELGYEGILIVGHIGKLVKLGAGIMNTHSSQADGRMEVLIGCGLMAGIEPSRLKRLWDCVTVDDALSILSEEEDGIERTMEVLMERIQKYLDAKVKQEIPIGAILFSNQYGVLGQTQSAGQLLEEVLGEYGTS